MILLGNIILAVALIAKTLLNIYFWIVIASALLSWVRPDPYSTVMRALTALTEPVFYRVRRLLPFTYTNGIDFSPVVVLIAIQLVEMIVVKSLLEWASLIR